MESFIAACAQFEILPMRVEDNLRIAWQTIKACKDATKADLIVLPETFTTGFTPIGGLSALWVAPISFSPAMSKSALLPERFKISA